MLVLRFVLSAKMEIPHLAYKNVSLKQNLIA